MFAFVVFLASVVLLGIGIRLRPRRRAPRAGTPPPVSTPLDPGEGLLPEDRDADGLATFYAYQMAAGRVQRTR